MKETLLDSLLKVTSEDCAYFLMWYNGNADEDEWEKMNLPLSEDEYKQWMTSSEGISAQIAYDKHMKNYKLSLLYNNMMNKALNGDVNAAKWIESFVKSDYFKESEDEIVDFLSGINIPGLE